MHGTAPLIPVEETFGFSGRDIVGALALGVIAGLGARWFARALREAKHIAEVTRPSVRVPDVGAGIACRA